MVERGTWDPEPVDLPPGRDPLGLKWVFKTKYTADNKIERLKGRLVVQGYAQTEGLDYLETFTPVVNMVSNPAIYSKVAKYDLELVGADVAGAYLYANVEPGIEIYVRQPKGFEIPNSKGKVLRLRRSLYGLKQAGHLWNKEIDSYLIGMGFRHCDNVDHAVYTMGEGNHFVAVTLYVDNIEFITKPGGETLRH